MAVDGSQAYSTIPDVIPAESVVIPAPRRKSQQDPQVPTDPSHAIDLSLDVDYLDYASDMVGGGPTAEEFRSPLLHFPTLHDDEEPSELFTRNPLYRDLVMEVRHHITPHMLDTYNTDALDSTPLCFTHFNHYLSPISIYFIHCFSRRWDQK